MSAENVEKKIINFFRNHSQNIIKENNSPEFIQKDEVEENQEPQLDDSKVQRLGEDDDFYKQAVGKINQFIEGASLNYDPMLVDKANNQFKWKGSVNNIEWGFEFGDYENNGLRLTANYDLVNPDALKALHSLAIFLTGDFTSNINNLLELNQDSETEM
jgi:hypothetical protein